VEGSCEHGNDFSVSIICYSGLSEQLEATHVFNSVDIVGYEDHSAIPAITYGLY
jgi:hypothetical protein